MIALQSIQSLQTKVLIVDDEMIARIHNKWMLERLGYAVTVACDGVEALNLLQNQSFDAILLDINLPKLSGIELTKTIRESSEAMKVIHIIGITADDDGKTHQLAKMAGMNAVVVKPVSAETINKLILTAR